MHIKSPQLFLPSLFLSLGGVTGACSDSGTTTAADASDVAASSDASITDAGAADAMASAPDAAPSDCAPEQLCFINHALGSEPIPNGRTVVMFYQFNDDLIPEPAFHLGYDEPFDGSQGTLEIPRSSITLPTPLDDYYLCQRICSDLSNDACNCFGEDARATFAFVFVVSDTDNSGAIELAEIDEANIFGVAGMHVNSAEQDFPIPNVFDSLFIDGVLQGIHGYTVEPSSGSFDVLTIPEPGAYFDMTLCVPGSDECADLPFPNLT